MSNKEQELCFRCGKALNKEEQYYYEGSCENCESKAWASLHIEDKEQVNIINHGNCSCPICVPSKYQLNKIMNEQVSVDEVDLKPCPFCGWHMIYIYADKNGLYEVSCVVCNCRHIGHYSKDKAISIWNNRPREIEKAEYERLKRLDENVKKKIAKIENLIDSNYMFDFPEMMRCNLELLKSLYDE